MEVEKGLRAARYIQFKARRADPPGVRKLVGGIAEPAQVPTAADLGLVVAPALPPLILVTAQKLKARGKAKAPSDA